MEVNVQKAVKMFFSNSSFEMIYSEAFLKRIQHIRFTPQI